MDDEIRGRIHSVESFGAVDGPGLRFVVFFQGCPLRCIYCHNPDTWDADSGKEITARELCDQILRYKNFIKNGGVTLSGGEPLMQSKFASEVLRLCKKNGFHTAVDTSGAVDLSICREAVDQADLILLDIKAIDDNLAKKITGASNRNTLKLLDYCEKTNKDVWIRHVLLPGFTLEKEHAHKLGAFLKDFRCVRKAELLPFHKIGEYKWQNLGFSYSLTDIQPPEEMQVDEIKSILTSYGINVG